MVMFVVKLLCCLICKISRKISLGLLGLNRRLLAGISGLGLGFVCIGVVGLQALCIGIDSSIFIATLKTSSVVNASPK